MSEAPEKDAKAKDGRRGTRRISFTEAPDIRATAAAAAAAASSANVKVEEAWSAAPKDDKGELSLSSLAVILDGIEQAQGGVKGGADHFIRAQDWLTGKTALTRNDFEIACNELEDWQLMSPEQLAAACAEEPQELPPPIIAKLTDFFNKLDKDNDKSITKEEAISHWGKNFAKINASAMFNEVDVDGDGKVTLEEWFAFWKNVLQHGYTVEEVEEELDELVQGGSWVDFNDGRNT